MHTPSADADIDISVRAGRTLLTPSESERDERQNGNEPHGVGPSWLPADRSQSGGAGSSVGLGLTGIRLERKDSKSVLLRFD